VQTGERVVTSSFNQLSDGRKVSVSSGEPGAMPPATAPNASRRPRGEAGEAQAEPRRDGQRRSERTEGSTSTR
jgi:hypothetical protein